MFGWSGSILRVDLSKGKIDKQPLNLDFAKSFLGGRGFNSKILYDEFNPEIIDPYSPENIVCVSPGLLSGTLAPGVGRVTVSVARSPITGVFGDGNAGGHFSPEIKYAGYDMIIIKGSSAKPVYLLIQDDSVEIKDASHLWGKDVWETSRMIKQDNNDEEIQILSIGPAGENLVSLAIPICNLTRAPGGCGTGAVMGSKKLKAIAVRGTGTVKIANPEEFKKACEDTFEHLKNHYVYDNWSKYGTTILTDLIAKSGWLASYNWQDAQFADWKKVSADAFLNYSRKSKACFNCPVHCSHYYEVNEGPYAGTRAEGLEYEAIGGFGPRSGSSNLPSILYMNKLLNQLGMCVVQTSNAVCTAMHFWQDKIIDANDTGGLNLEWGNHEAMVELIKQIAYRKGFGDILANGVLQGARQIAEKKGLPAEKLEYYVIQTKGNTFCGGDVRMWEGFSLEMGTSTRGADHLRGEPTIETFWYWYRDKPDEVVKDLNVPPEIVKQWFEMDIMKPGKYEGKGYLVKFYQDQCTASDALEICRFLTSWRLGVGPPRMARFVTAATGIDYTWKDILQCGERIYTVEYAMQRRYGLRRDSDFPPERFFKEKVPSGPQKGAKLDKEKYNKMLSEYYEIRGYDNEGIPTGKKLEELGLKDVKEDLEKRGIIKKKKSEVKK